MAVGFSLLYVGSVRGLVRGFSEHTRLWRDMIDAFAWLFVVQFGMFVRSPRFVSRVPSVGFGVHVGFAGSGLYVSVLRSVSFAVRCRRSSCLRCGLYSSKGHLYKPSARKPWLNGLPRACTLFQCCGRLPVSYVGSVRGVVRGLIRGLPGRVRDRDMACIYGL